MDLLYSGFDGLDIAYRCTVPKMLAARLEHLKSSALETGCDASGQFGPLSFSVSSKGAQGGFAYLCSTGPQGALFAFKKPNPKDPWGVRVSVRALTLATQGLDGAREYVEDTLRGLGFCPAPQAESISRIDLAFDYLAPAFKLNQTQFVMHARSNRKTHFDLGAVQENGRSGRVTSVTIGKNPGQQVIVYDKRDEVISRRKVAWPVIWDARRVATGLPRLDMSDPGVSRVWRVELRAHKRHLKDRWGISTWHDLSSEAPKMFTKMLEDIRYAAPRADSNRARWPDHPLWQAVRRDLGAALEGMPSLVEPDAIRRALVEERARMIMAQIEGCLLSHAILLGVPQDALPEAIQERAQTISQRFASHPEQTKERIAKVNARFAGLVNAQRDQA